MITNRVQQNNISEHAENLPGTVCNHADKDPAPSLSGKGTPTPSSYTNKQNCHLLMQGAGVNELLAHANNQPQSTVPPTDAKSNSEIIELMCIMHSKQQHPAVLAILPFPAGCKKSSLPHHDPKNLRSQ